MSRVRLRLMVKSQAYLGCRWEEEAKGSIEPPVLLV